jgi:hypothetical protein
MRVLIALICLLNTSIGWAQKVTTLTCIDNANPNFQFSVSFDELSKNVFWGDKIHRNAVSNNLITYDDVMDGSTYKTHIYRDTGRFTVFVSGKLNFNFGGTCTRKTSNKF